MQQWLQIWRWVWKFLNTYHFLGCMQHIGVKMTIMEHCCISNWGSLLDENCFMYIKCLTRNIPLRYLITNMIYFPPIWPHYKCPCFLKLPQYWLQSWRLLGGISNCRTIDKYHRHRKDAKGSLGSYVSHHTGSAFVTGCCDHCQRGIYVIVIFTENVMYYQVINISLHNYSLHGET